MTLMQSLDGRMLHVAIVGGARCGRVSAEDSHVRICGLGLVDGHPRRPKRIVTLDRLGRVGVLVVSRPRSGRSRLGAADNGELRLRSETSIVERGSRRGHSKLSTGRPSPLDRSAVVVVARGVFETGPLVVFEMLLAVLEQQVVEELFLIDSALTSVTDRLGHSDWDTLTLETIVAGSESAASLHATASAGSEGSPRQCPSSS